MQHEMLQIAIGRADWAAQPGRDENSDGSEPIRMDIQEAENFRLRKSNGVEDSSGLKAAVLAEFDYHLHAKGPLSLFVSARKTKVLIDLPAHCTHRSVRYDGECRTHIHPRHKPISGETIKTDSLIGETNPADCLILNQRFAHRHSRP